MSEIVRELQAALWRLSLPEEAFRPCDEELAEVVVSLAKERFVEGNPRSWWHALKHRGTVFAYPKRDGCLHLLEHIPPEERRCWFIPETEEENLPVFDVQTAALAPVLSRCFCFEYYLVGKNFDWLVIETAYHDVIVSRVPTAPDAAATARFRDPNRRGLSDFNLDLLLAVVRSNKRT
jgi:hypothetical protein